MSDMLKESTTKGSLKEETTKAKAPVAKGEGIQYHDGGSLQKSLHPHKSQSRTMRFLKK